MYKRSFTGLGRIVVNWTRTRRGIYFVRLRNPQLHARARDHPLPYRKKRHVPPSTFPPNLSVETAGDSVASQQNASPVQKNTALKERNTWKRTKIDDMFLLAQQPRLLLPVMDSINVTKASAVCSPSSHTSSEKHWILSSRLLEVERWTGEEVGSRLTYIRSRNRSHCRHVSGKLHAYLKVDVHVQLLW